MSQNVTIVLMAVELCECAKALEGSRFLSLLGKVYSSELKERLRQIVNPQIQEERCSFHPDRGTKDQIFTLTDLLKCSWELGLSSKRVL